MLGGVCGVCECWWTLGGLEEACSGCMVCVCMCECWWTLGVNINMFICECVHQDVRRRGRWRRRSEMHDAPSRLMRGLQVVPLTRIVRSTMPAVRKRMRSHVAG